MGGTYSTHGEMRNSIFRKTGREETNWETDAYILKSHLNTASTGMN
jgi:hypothetical protein